MALHIDSAKRNIVLGAHDALILGIITRGDRVRLATGDPYTRPGHVEWVRRDNMPDALYGFSLLVKNGEVAALHPVSRLNLSAPGHRLSRDTIRELEAMFPRSRDYQLLLY